jgi:hypothetical protein
MRRYVNGGAVPKSVGVGRKLMHNHIRHTVDIPAASTGFAAGPTPKCQPVL